MKGLKILLILLVLVILMVAAWQNIPPILEKSITFQLDLHWAKWQTEPIPLYLIIWNIPIQNSIIKICSWYIIFGYPDII